MGDSVWRTAEVAVDWTTLSLNQLMFLHRIKSWTRFATPLKGVEWRVVSCFRPCSSVRRVDPFSATLLDAVCTQAGGLLDAGAQHPGKPESGRGGDHIHERAKSVPSVPGIRADVGGLLPAGAAVDGPLFRRRWTLQYAGTRGPRRGSVPSIGSYLAQRPSSECEHGPAKLGEAACVRSPVWKGMTSVVVLDNLLPLWFVGQRSFSARVR